MGALERILRVGTLPGPPGARGRGLGERRHRQQWDLPQSGSDLMLNDRHRRLRRASAGRLRGSTPDRDRPVYIYCNNNFADDRVPVVTKKVELALNIPTFINLVGYGYANVWELADVIRTDGPGVNWVAATS